MDKDLREALDTDIETETSTDEETETSTDKEREDDTDTELEDMDTDIEEVTDGKIKVFMDILIAGSTATDIGKVTSADTGEEASVEIAHPSCITGKNTGKDKSQINQWVCHGCKLCAFCFETSENEAMAVCVECGDAYHLTCHNPPITEEQWHTDWLCSTCDDIDKADIKPTDVKPDVKPIDIKPADVKPVDIKSVDVKPADIKLTIPKATPGLEVTATTAPTTIKSKRLIEEDPFFKKYVPKEKTPDPTNWTVDEVCKYLQEHGCAAQAEAFRHHEIDGRSLLLLTRRDVLYELGLKLGPALKVNHFVQLLQKKDIRQVFPFNEMLR